jgi:poly(A) polymerase
MDAKIYATHIVQKLTKEGYIAYFAGGWVRDFIMKHPSDDIDIATDAPPQQILDLFPHTLLVGLSFGVVIVVLEGHQFEVSTFRKDLGYENGRTPLAIELSEPREDALRRDFTINGMFYDPLTEQITDFVGGQEDIEKKVIRTIGNPYERFSEDRLRMIRAVRFSARFGFSIDLDTYEAISENATTLFPAVAMERIWQEFNKMAAFPHFDQALIELHRLGLLAVIFPQLEKVHLHTLKKQVSVLEFFPQGTPTILALMELFPDSSLEEQLHICQYLKSSNQDWRLVENTYKLREAMEKDARTRDFDKVTWAYLYAHPLFDLSFHVIVARQTAKERQSLIHTHHERKQTLKTHVDRIIQKKPLVNASLLQELGIPTGKVMGLLLKEAEKIAITNQLDEAQSVIQELHRLPLWDQSIKG